MSGGSGVMPYFSAIEVGDLRTWLRVSEFLIELTNLILKISCSMTGLDSEVEKIFRIGEFDLACIETGLKDQVHMVDGSASDDKVCKNLGGTTGMSRAVRFEVRKQAVNAKEVCVGLLE
ncbi:hypothetical protein SARC_10675 [Sphaeroforma arctica JP610]|uniref:Uncharacterized protein n=1 Tax=Sphaeroforma arctica JP610 TaxID=667725 RepID=A0A0L0FJA8_9EUKA|nr:hypothetical protein SARC_10675 [Sphaeroforma arctica JP610]KNC76850.1 hypothetical protein SARC_10675 [Sphaeroforma arctica JP610]|eukprot:XP_014150752.1 hypothetical protein SARC_10675 [Sphaeroforma arctica JP610]